MIGAKVAVGTLNQRLSSYVNKLFTFEGTHKYARSRISHVIPRRGKKRLDWNSYIFSCNSLVFSPKIDHVFSTSRPLPYLRAVADVAIDSNAGVNAPVFLAGMSSWCVGAPCLAAFPSCFASCLSCVEHGDGHGKSHRKAHTLTYATSP